MYEPDSPGKIMPLIPIIPHINTKNKFEFSVAGVTKFKENEIVVPIINVIIDCVFQFFTLFPIKITDARISPKKNAQINIG